MSCDGDQEREKDAPAPAAAPIGRRSADAELASSSPDFNHMMMRLVRQLFAPIEKAGWLEKNLRLTMGSVLGTLMLFFVVGLPSMTGGALLLDKWNEGRDRDRAFQLDMFKLQTDVEIKKLDRTMLGDGAMATLKEIIGKLDAQGDVLTAQGQQLERLTSKVSGIEAGQAGDRRRLAAVAEEQRLITQARSKATAIPSLPATETPRPR